MIDPSSSRIVLVRHGQARTPGAAYGPDTPLTPLGERQAEVTAKAIVDAFTPVEVYASPLPRAVQTAQPLCRWLDRAPRIDARLAELEMVPWEPAAPQPDLVIWEAHHRGAPEGETLADFAARTAAWVEEVCERHAGECVVAYTHSGTIDAIARWAVGLPTDSPWTHDLPLYTASVTELVIWPRGRAEGGAPRHVSFVRVGDVAHLAPSLREGS